VVLFSCFISSSRLPSVKYPCSTGASPLRPNSDVRHQIVHLKTCCKYT
jgi:hypothetical protein